MRKDAQVDGREEVLKSGEVATYLGVSTRTVYGQIDRGELPAADFESEYRILREHAEVLCSNTPMSAALEHEPMAFEKLPDDRLMETEEVSTFLRFERDTIRRMARKNIIFARKIGQQWRFEPEKIMRMFGVKQFAESPV